MVLIGLVFSLHRGGIQRAGAAFFRVVSRATVGGAYIIRNQKSHTKMKLPIDSVSS
jgi:hypothetical protein